MEITVYPSKVRGELVAPPSKSMGQRALGASLLRNGKTILHNLGTSEDEHTALGIIRNLGAKVVSKEKNSLTIQSQFPLTKATEREIYCGESGLSFRMFSFLAPLFAQSITIRGSERLAERNRSFPVNVFEKLGVTVQRHGNGITLTQQGQLIPKDVEIDGSKSSQWLTGLLMAYSALAVKDRTITVKSLKSKPYIDLTLELLYDFGFKVPTNHNYGRFYFANEAAPAVPETSTISYTVEGDWSNAAFLLVAGAISGKVGLSGLKKDSLQGDERILEILEDSECPVHWVGDRVVATEPTLGSFYFDATDCPDLFPPAVALAACNPGMSVIKGISRLVNKESNRALALQEEFGKLGVRIMLQEDEMIIEGSAIQSGRVNARGDHRIAMALGVAATAAKGPIVIEGAESVSKSYPSFWKDLEALGVRLERKG